MGKAKPSYEELEKQLAQALAELNALRAIPTDNTPQSGQDTVHHETNEIIFRQLVEAQGDVYWLGSLDWRRVYYVNPAYEAVWGRSRQSLYEAPLSWMEAILEEDREPVEATIAGVASLADFNEVRFPEYRILGAEGALRWIAARAFPIRDSSGKVVCVAGIAEDVTERVQIAAALRESQESYRHIFQNAQVGLFRTRIDDGKVLECNDAGAHMFGYANREEAIEQYLAAWHYFSLQDREKMLVSLREKGELDGYELELRRKDGQLLWVRVSMKIYPREGWIEGVIEDITDSKRIEAALRQERDLAQKYLNIAGVILVVLNAQGEITLLNRKGYEVLGYDEGELLGRNWFDTCLPVSVRQKVHHIFSQIMASEDDPDSGFTVVENPVLTKSGEERMIRWQNILLKGEKGQKIGTLSSGEDITERQRIETALRDSEARFRLAFEEGPLGFVITDNDLKFVAVNRAYCAMTGYTAEELLDKSFVDITHPEDLPRDLALRERMCRGEIPSYKIEKRYLTKSGAVIWGALTTALIRDQHGNILYEMGMVEDITERKKAADALAQKSEDLARTNAELERFIYTASHHLQEPLRKLQSFVDLLELRLANTLSEQEKRYLNAITHNAQIMQELVIDLVDYSRFVRKELNLTTFNMTDALQQALNILRDEIEESQAVVTHDPLPDIVADKEQVIVLLYHLIQNALKFRSAERPRVHISVEKRAEAPQGASPEWQFGVSDNGIGIASEHLERIFTLYYRLHHRDEYPGTGIGLPICRKVVERHGGSIWAESQEGKGTRIYFTLSKSGAKQ